MNSEFINDPKDVIVLQVLLFEIRDNYLNSKKGIFNLSPIKLTKVVIAKLLITNIML